MYRTALLAAALASPLAAHARAPQYGERVALRSHHGTYVVAESDGRLNANRGGVGPWETFTLLDGSGNGSALAAHFEQHLSLRSDHGFYVVAEDHGAANANRPAVGGWEQFTAVDPAQPGSGGTLTCGGQIALRSYHGRYLVAEGNGDANANRDAIGAWEVFTLECLDPPRETVLRIVGAGDVALRLDTTGIVWQSPTEATFAGDLIFESNGRSTTLIDGDVALRLTASGELDTLDGTARVPMHAQGPFVGMSIADPARARVGLMYGRDLVELEAPLQADRRYIFADLEVGLDMRAGLSRLAFGAGETVILDPADPFLFGRGELRGFGFLTPIQSIGIGTSIQGLAHLSAHRTWGIEDQPSTLDGQLYLSGRVAVPAVPPVANLTLDGEILGDLDPRHDGIDFEQAQNDQHLLGNGVVKFNVGFMAFTLVSVELGEGTIITRDAEGDGADIYVSGVTDNDHAGVDGQVPFRLEGEVLLAGHFTQNRADARVQLGANLRVGGHTLADGLVTIDDNGVGVRADVDLLSVSVAVSGRSEGPQHLDLQGSATTRVPMFGPKIITELVPQRRWFEDDVRCGTQQVQCGVERVQCGTEWITDAGRCGVHTIWDGVCWLFGCERPNRCEVPRFCDHPIMCVVNNSCWLDVMVEQTRVEPQFEWGVYELTLGAQVSPGGVGVTGGGRFCPFDGAACVDLPAGAVRASGDGFEVCFDVPGFGHACTGI